MKVKIVTRMFIQKKWLDEVVELIPGITFEVVKTDKQLSTYYRPEQQSMYCDFGSLVTIANDTTVAVRAFFMPYSELLGLGVTNHLALYNNSDRDGIFDFYVGLKDTLDPRAKENGFKSNFAWEFVHEILHGYEQNLGKEYMATNGDRTHAMESQGKLKQLLVEDNVTIPGLQMQLAKLTEMLSNLLKKKMTHPIPLPYRNQITQQYAVSNPIYSKTGHHIGCDYSCPMGTPLRAPADGQVVTSSWSKERGYYIQFKHGNYVLEMRHLSKKLPVGAYKQSDIIAYSGNTGALTTGPHVCMVCWIGSDGLSRINKSNWMNLTIDPNKLYI